MSKFQIWSFYPSIIISLISILSSILLAYAYDHWKIGIYISDGFSSIFLVLSTTIVIITFKFTKKSTSMSPAVIRAEKLLLYNTSFITFWLVIAQIFDAVSVYLSYNKMSPEWLELAFYDIIYFAMWISNPGSLLYLLYLSSMLRDEFRQTFGFLWYFKKKKIFVAISTIFSRQTHGQ